MPKALSKRTIAFRSIWLSNILKIDKVVNDIFRSRIKQKGLLHHLLWITTSMQPSTSWSQLDHCGFDEIWQATTFYGAVNAANAFPVCLRARTRSQTTKTGFLTRRTPIWPLKTKWSNLWKTLKPFNWNHTNPARTESSQMPAVLSTDGRQRCRKPGGFASCRGSRERKRRENILRGNPTTRSEQRK